MKVHFDSTESAPGVKWCALTPSGPNYKHHGGVKKFKFKRGVPKKNILSTKRG